jgi:hypothetical protein
MVKPSEVPDAWLKKRVLVTMPTGTRFEGTMTYCYTYITKKFGYFIFRDCKTLNKDGSFRAKSIEVRDFSSTNCYDSGNWDFELVEELPEIHTVADLLTHGDKYVGSEIEIDGYKSFRGQFIEAVSMVDDTYIHIKLDDVKYVDKSHRMNLEAKKAWREIGGYLRQNVRAAVVSKTKPIKTDTKTKKSKDLTPEQVEAKLIEYVQERWPKVNRKIDENWCLTRDNVETYKIAETFVAILKELTEPEKE